MDVIEFIRRENSMPGVTDGAIYKRLYKFRSDPAFQAKLKEDLIAWEIFEKSKDSPQLQAAKDVIEFISKNGRLPKSAQDPPLYARLLRYREDDEFLSELRKDPKAWAILEQSMLSPADLAALDLIDHVSKHGKLPNAREDTALNLRISRYRNDEVFRARLKQDSKAWELFQKRLTR